jgi:tetratricopeptide (TPR) repeat protein
MVQTLALVVGFAIISTGAAKERPGSPKSFSRMLQFSDGSVRYRKALWETGARFLQAGPQPILPDGTRDSNYLLRRAIGYGPECSWLVTNSFATPALVLNRFQESENRMHNEIFDAIITTGYAGTMAYLWIIVAAYYYSLRFFGFAVERLEKIIYVVLSCVGIAAGFCVPWAVGTPQFIGIGVEAGLLAGIFAFVAWSGFRNVRERFEMGGRQLLVLGILGALTAHFIEIGVAVAVTPTRLYFYLYLAVLAVCCSRGWVSEEEPAKRNKGKSLRPDASPLLPFAALSALVVFVESWCFTFSVSDEKSALTLFAQSWFGFFSGDRGRMPTALVLILVTLCAGAGLAYAEKPGVQISRAGLRRSILGSTASLLAAWVATGMISALFWTALENATPLEYSRHCEARITFFVLGLLLLVTIAALIINNREMAQSRVSAIPMKKALIAILLFSFAVIGIWRLTLRPAWADTACRIARAYEAARNYVGAAQQYERASQFAPQVVPYRFSLGLAQRAAAGLDSMQLEQARASIEKALDLNRLDPIVYRTLGTFHMYVGEHSLESQARASEIAKAIGHFQKAARLAPNHPDAYVQMGRCLSLLGEYDRANGFFQKSLQMNPNYWQCYKYLGEMQYRQKDFSGALKSFEKAAYLNPDDMDSPKNIGVLLMLLGRTEDAIRANLEALKKAPNDFELLTRVASWYFGQGNNVTGTEFAKRAYDVSPSANKGSFEAFKGRLQSQMRN